MNILQNPSEEKIQELIQQSEMKAANWLRDLETDDLFYWPADRAQHASVASELALVNWEKGVET